MTTIKFSCIPEFAKELGGGRSTASFVYALIIEESVKNYKAGKNAACEASSQWFQEKIEVSKSSSFRTLKTLRDKGFIRQEKLNQSERYYRDGCHVTNRYIPLRFPTGLKDMNKEVI